MTKIKIVSAMGRGNMVIGQSGSGMPWGRTLKDDLKHFKDLTMGHALLLGRRTFTNDVKRALPGRINIVLTRNPSFQAEGCITCTDVAHLHRHVPWDKDLFVIGGGEIYELMIPMADEMHLTVIDHVFAGDVFFPFPTGRDLTGRSWACAKKDAQHQPRDDRNQYSFTRYLWGRI